MANTLYDLAREKFATAALDWTSITVKGVLVDTGNYTFSAAHTDLTKIGVPARVATSSAFTSKTATGGACDAADVTLTTVSGATAEAFVIYHDTGTESTSTLIAYLDSATGLPITPNGGDIVLTWDNGINRIFRL